MRRYSLRRFFAYLVLSALWIACRHRFSPGGIGLAVLAVVGGGLALLVYLFWASMDARSLLLGRDRALGEVA